MLKEKFHRKIQAYDKLTSRLCRLGIEMSSSVFERLESKKKKKKKTQPEPKHEPRSSRSSRKRLRHSSTDKHSRLRRRHQILMTNPTHRPEGQRSRSETRRRDHKRPVDQWFADQRSPKSPTSPSILQIIQPLPDKPSAKSSRETRTKPHAKRSRRHKTTKRRAQSQTRVPRTHLHIGRGVNVGKE